MEIDQAFVNAITPFVGSGTISAKDVSIKLEKILDLPVMMFNRQHEIYVSVVIYLDGLCEKGKYICVSKSKNDVKYRVKR